MYGGTTATERANYFGSWGLMAVLYEPVVVLGQTILSIWMGYTQQGNKGNRSVKKKDRFYVG